MARVLVTGGCGFVGRHLVQALAARGDEVRVLDLSGPRTGRPAGGICAGIGGRPCASANGRWRGSSASTTWPASRICGGANKDDFDLVNRRGTETILAAAAAKGIGRIVHCSTESILLPRRRNHKAIDESVAPRLEDMPGAYTRSKYLGERAALRAARGGQDVVVVNPTVPIGNGDRNMTPPAAMFALFLAGRTPFFLDCVLNLVDVRDLADGILRAADEGRSGERYILGGENVALRDLLRSLERLSGRKMPKRACPGGGGA